MTQGELRVFSPVLHELLAEPALSRQARHCMSGLFIAPFRAMLSGARINQPCVPMERFAE